MVEFKDNGSHWFGWFQEAKDQGATHFTVGHSQHGYGSDGEGTEIETYIQARNVEERVIMKHMVCSTYIGEEKHYEVRERDYLKFTVPAEVRKALTLAKGYKDSFDN